jgi:type VI secretion system protein ImpJ
MSHPAVHWHEGMFLRPHHFMAAQRHSEHLAHRGEKFDLAYNWGLRSVEIDTDALANSRLVVRSLSARLRDGTLVSVPEDGVLPSFDLKGALGSASAVTAYLGVPLVGPGRANVAEAGAGADGVRYLLDTQVLDDENTGVNPQPVKVRRLNLKLLLSTQDHSGYEVIPLARLVKSTRAEALPQLDESFIPPVLACDAWKVLSAGILQSVYDRIGKKIDLLATQVVTRNIGFDSHAQGDPLIFAQLRELNESYARLGVLAFAEGVHPFDAYLELAQLVGRLSIFGATRRPPPLPRYDHDDLGVCFFRAKQHVDALLDFFVEPDYKERPFVGAGLRMQVALEPAWLESVWQIYIGVQSTLEAEECVRLLTKPGQLDMKVGSSDRVDTIFRMGLAGLQFDHSQNPPRALPSAPGLIYFQVRRESQLAEWQNVHKSLTLAVRLNENLITGNIQGQRVLSIRTGPRSTTLMFTLYVVPANEP